MRNVILASQSPRRQELLQRLVPAFSVQPADIDESMDPAMAPEQAVCDLARRKARAIAGEHPQSLVIAADTIVVCDTIFGKPEDEADAARMLRALAGRAHQVMTAVSVVGDGGEETRVSVTDVHFRPMSEQEIAAYIATGEPMDKAGAYGIQGAGSLFIERIEGDYYGVMGLPVCMLYQMLEKFPEKG
ncbi:MAG: Maf family protein [Eubacteriales bacterium]|nr:Maf family protein [Eubacteriales bacterium]